jgi:predicted dehydrogenase
MSASSAPERAGRPIRWGIASTGSIAGSMTEALQSLDDPETGAEVVAVGSRNQATADGFAERFGIARAHGSYDDLFADDDVDIVYIASPHTGHCEMTVAALQAGRHVLCEKPFAVNTTEARSMVAAARANDRFLMEAMWTWFIPAIVDIKRRIVAGEIGELTVIESDFGISVTNEDGRHRRIDLAGGALLDLGIYPVSLARFLTGEPVGRVSELTALARLGPTGVDSTLGGVLRLDDDVISVFHTSLDATTTLRATVLGTGGRIEIDPPFWFTSGFTVLRNGQPAERVELPNRGLAHEAAHAMERLRAGELESDVIPLEVSLQTMEILDEIRRQVGVIYPGE